MSNDVLRAAMAAWVGGLPSGERERVEVSARTVIRWLELSDAEGYAALLRGDVDGVRAARLNGEPTDPHPCPECGGAPKWAQVLREPADACGCVVGCEKCVTWARVACERCGGRAVATRART